MNTLALRLYGKMDLRLETFQLQEPREDEILAGKYALCAELAQLCDRHNGLWNLEAEEQLLSRAPKVI